MNTIALESPTPGTDLRSENATLRQVFYNNGPTDKYEPRSYYARTYKPYSIQVQAVQGDYVISSPSGAYGSYFDGFRASLNHYSDELRKFRHEFVDSKLTEKTDLRLSSLDPEWTKQNESWYHRYTPDHYNKMTNCLFELGTVNSNDTKVMKDHYELKRKKYQEASQILNIEHVYIMIVGPDGVYTDVMLSDAMADELCHRCRFGLAVENAVITISGEDIFRHDDDLQITNLVSQMLSKIPQLDRKDFDFDPEYLKRFREPQSAEGKARVSDIMEKVAEESTKFGVDHPDEYAKWKSGFTDDKCNPHKRRITNFPFVKSKKVECHETMKLGADTLESIEKDDLRKAWLSCVQSKVIGVEKKEIRPNQTKLQMLRHRHQKDRAFKVDFTRDEAIMAAQTGIEGRTHRFDREVQAHEELGHLSISPDADTSDITEFLNNSLTGYTDVKGADLFALLNHAKNATQDDKSLSFEMFRDFIFPSDIVQYSDMISDIVTELTYMVRLGSKPHEFHYKYLRKYQICMIMKCTGSMIFVSYCFQKDHSEIIDTGRLGPALYETDSHIITDWCSYSSESLDHFVKSGPYMAALLSHLMSFNELDITKLDKESFFTKENDVLYTAKFLLLTYLCNKVDLEETLTMQRYFFMGMFDELAPNCYGFVDRLPKVLRSRMTAYAVTKTEETARYYYENGIKKNVSEYDDEDSAIEFTNLMPIMCRKPVKIDKLIDSFYFGYVVTKAKQKGTHNSSTICEKLIKEEIKYQNNRRAGKKCIDRLDKAEPHRNDEDVLHFFINSFQEILKIRVGANYQDILRQDILLDMGTANFSGIATLKASGRKYDDTINNEELRILSQNDATTMKEATKVFKRLHPDYFTSRPKVLEALTKLASEKAEDDTLLFELIPFCIDALMSKNGFDSDLFSKPQHGGHREVHVMEIMARLLQYFLEKIARGYCKRFKGEALTHPGFKDQFMREHLKLTETAGLNLTGYKSADAKTWCQMHHVSRFAAMLIGITDPIFHNFIYHVEYLWTQKKVYLPADLISMFIANRETPMQQNSVLSEMRERFYAGTFPFIKPMEGKVIIQSGMFQGTQHYTSSLYHTMVQEVILPIEMKLYEGRFNEKMVVTKLQSSDDSASLNSFKATKKDLKIKLRFMGMLMRFKENLCKWICIIPSLKKTLLLSLIILEFNSVWRVKTKVINPTVRWVSASMEQTVTESFMTRYRTSSNILTQCLEGGASTLLCAMIQLCQAWLHYKMVGLDVHPDFTNLRYKLTENPNPAYGFFPLDPDITAGMLGVDYSIYRLALRYDVLLSSSAFHFLSEKDQWRVNSSKSYLVTEQLKVTTLRLMSIKKWIELRQRLSEIPDQERLLYFYEENPEALFMKHNRWGDDKFSIAVKLYSPGVKGSLSTDGSFTKMVVASEYMLNTECMTVFGQDKKFKLLDLFDLPRVDTKYQMKDFFPLLNEYVGFDKMIKHYGDNKVMHIAEYTRRSKTKVEVLSHDSGDMYPLIDVCKRKWFNRDYYVKVGSFHFREIWKRMKLKYGFLKDTLKETQEKTGLNVVELKHLLEEIITKTRVIRLVDSSAKGSSLSHTVSRLYWPNIKLLLKVNLKTEFNIDILKSGMFAITTFPYSDVSRTIEAKELLVNMKFLEEEYGNLQTSAQMLKIQYDFVKGVQKSQILDMLLHKKFGLIGYFNFPQGRNKDGSRFGGGTWIGKISNLSVEVMMMNNDCVWIKVNSLEAGSRYAAELVNQLLRELHLNVMENPQTSKSQTYLTNAGRILFSLQPIKYSIPINVDSNFKIEIISYILEKPWVFEVNNFSTKIKVSDAHESFSICTVGYSYNDWDSSCKPPISDAYILKYHNSEPLLLSETMKWFEDNVKHKIDRHNIKRVIARRYHTMLDLTRLKSHFEELWLGERKFTKSSSTEQIAHPDEITGPHVNPEYIESLINYVNNPSLTTDNEWERMAKTEVLDWAEDVSKNDNKTPEDFYSGIFVDEEELASFANMLMTNRKLTSEEKEITQSKQPGLVIGNKFYANIVGALNREITNLYVEDLYNKNMPMALIESLSVIMSMFTGRLFYTDDIVPDDSVSNILPEFDSDDGKLEQLMIEIDKIDQDISLVGGSQYHKTLIGRKNKLIENVKQRLMVYESKKRHDFSDRVSMDAVFKEIFEVGGVMIDQAPMLVNDCRLFFRKECLRIKEHMNWIEDEFDDIRLQLRNESFITEVIWRLIAIVFHCDIEVNKAGEPLYSFRLSDICPESLAVHYGYVLIFDIDTMSAFFEYMSADDPVDE